MYGLSRASFLSSISFICWEIWILSQSISRWLLQFLQKYILLCYIMYHGQLLQKDTLYVNYVLSIVLHHAPRTISFFCAFPRVVLPRNSISVLREENKHISSYILALKLTSYYPATYVLNIVGVFVRLCCDAYGYRTFVSMWVLTLVNAFCPAGCLHRWY